MNKKHVHTVRTAKFAQWGSLLVLTGFELPRSGSMAVRLKNRRFFNRQICAGAQIRGLAAAMEVYMSNVENAVHCFGNGFNCAQAVFSVYSEQLGLSKEEALKIACPFGGGMARMAETCGAVTGAYMLIGLKHGKYLPEDNEAREKSYAMVREFNKRFSEIHGTIVCRELLKNDMNNPEDLKKIKEKEMFTTLCPVFVRDSATIIGELLELE